MPKEKKTDDGEKRIENFTHELLKLIQQELEPEDVFAEWQLSDWAIDSGNYEFIEDPQCL